MFQSTFPPPYDSLNLNHDTNCLMTSEGRLEYHLMSAKFYLKGKCSILFDIKSKAFPFRVTNHLLLSFLMQETLKSVFLPPYKSLKSNQDANYLMHLKTRLKIC